jgi:predicted CDP-diglyceride synthetase/phosphatidate cytidylyltransferase
MQKQQRSFFKSRTWVTVFLIFGVTLLIAGLAELLFMPVDGPGNMAISFVTFGFILVFLAGARLFRDETDFLQDERTRKIGAYGLSWSWFLTFIMLFGFFWLDYLGIYKPDAGTLAVILILLMGVSAKVFQWYLFRKGDVE